ncbi:MAG TPA: site-specific DNA-methyltransferase [Candidatus Baltobacteraceae bacterium]|nr:site-specific DNA-methyltransferase [Candidatus Baltobacteraceae bacterium]
MPPLLVNANCVKGAVLHLSDASVDLIITDPPYGIEGDRLHRHYNRDERFVIDGYVEVDKRSYNAFSRAWIAQAERVLRPGGQIYIVSGYTNLYDVLDALRATSLVEINHLVWKYNFGVYTSTKFVSSHYHILYYAKPGGGRTFNLEARFPLDAGTEEGGSANYRDREDVWVINREYKPGRVKNKNELPVQLLEKMLAYSSNEGDLVCDFFMGGGSTGALAVGMNRRFAGFEISKKAFDACVRRIDAVEPGSLLRPAPRPHVVRNRGKAWSIAESQRLHERYDELFAQGMSKGAIVGALSREFKRGTWAIRKRLALLPEVGLR